AHITGGGLPGNLPRALPAALAAAVDPGSWPLPSIHRLVAGLAGLAGPEVRATFNGGLGMVAVVPEIAEGLALETLAGRGIPAWTVGQVVEAAGGPRYREVA
ncbi:MAG: AIR synthase-related protein, partial [Candidatus Limnocylindrales bacterium]